MRIALTADPELPVPPKLYGGIERVVDLLAVELHKRGHEVTLFCNPASTCAVKRVGWRGMRSRSRVATIQNAMDLASAALSRRFDVVHSFSRIAYLAPILPMRIPKLMSFQREISAETTGVAHTLSRGTLEFTAISRAMIHRVPLRGVWHMIPNLVSAAAYDFVQSQALDAPLVFLGRIEKIKGPHIAIEVARRTGRALILAGNIPTEHKGWFDREIAPKVDGSLVTYVGPVDDSRKNELLGRASALLMPILWEEPFGIVMIEAMACGTPVIGFRRGAVPEVVEDGVTGFVVDSLEAMVEQVGCIDQVTRDDCRKRVETMYSSSQVVGQYELIYERIAGRAA